MCIHHETISNNLIISIPSFFFASLFSYCKIFVINNCRIKNEESRVVVWNYGAAEGDEMICWNSLSEEYRRFGAHSYIYKYMQGDDEWNTRGKIYWSRVSITYYALSASTLCTFCYLIEWIVTLSIYISMVLLIKWKPMR